MLEKGHLCFKQVRHTQQFMQCDLPVSQGHSRKAGLWGYVVGDFNFLPCASL